MGIGIPLRSHSYGRDYDSELKTLFSNCEFFLPGYHIAQGETVTWIGNHWDFWAQRLLLWVKNSELGWFKPLMFQVGKQGRKKERAEKKLPDDHTARNDFRTEHILLHDSFPVPVTRMFSTSKGAFYLLLTQVGSFQHSSTTDREAPSPFQLLGPCCCVSVQTPQTSSAPGKRQTVSNPITFCRWEQREFDAISSQV